MLALFLWYIIFSLHSELFFPCLPLNIDILWCSVFTSALLSLSVFSHKCHASVIVVITLHFNFFVCLSFYPLGHVISFHLAIPSLAQRLAHSRCSVNEGRITHFIVSLYVFLESPTLFIQCPKLSMSKMNHVDFF